ncbi:MAG: TlpA family protein disulfide reductase [Bacillales bacterium]|nr:TlpA family protein disulfide reductase [Bacillales bacterium]
MTKKKWGVLMIASLLLIIASQHLKADKIPDTSKREANDQSILTEKAGRQDHREKKGDRLPGLKIGENAPDFTLPTLKGDWVHLRERKGQKVIINFWATWCPPCKEEIPVLQTFYEQNKGLVELLAVNIDPESNVSHFAEEYGISYPILLDKDGTVNETYKVAAIPTTYVIDENGMIIDKHIGNLQLQQMTNWLK